MGPLSTGNSAGPWKADGLDPIVSSAFLQIVQGAFTGMCSRSICMRKYSLIIIVNIVNEVNSAVSYSLLLSSRFQFKLLKDTKIGVTLVLPVKSLSKTMLSFIIATTARGYSWPPCAVCCSPQSSTRFISNSRIIALLPLQLTISFTHAFTYFPQHIYNLI